MPYLPDFPARPRRSLQTAGALQAQRRYLLRLQELRDLAAPLAQLDEEHERLAEFGLSVDPSALYLARERVGCGNSLRNIVRLYTASPLAPAGTTQRWLDAFHAAGFAYVSHEEGPHQPTVLMRKGLLHLRIDLPRAAVQTPATERSAERTAA
jgi:hypothetical protein